MSKTPRFAFAPYRAMRPSSGKRPETLLCYVAYIFSTRGLQRHPILRYFALYYIKLY